MDISEIHQQDSKKNNVVQRKPIKPRSEAWLHFTKFTTTRGEVKAKCNYCSVEFCCDPKKNGTGQLIFHIPRCSKKPDTKKQTELVLLPKQGVLGGHTILTSWKFDQDVIRRCLCRMIIADELSFRFVEGLGFKEFMAAACPRFVIPSRWTITRDCHQFYYDEKLKMKELLRKSCQRVCLTTDTWTSLQRINYMCLTAHFIDENWILQKKILNFCPISSHKGEAIGKAVENCLVDWKIDKVFTITVDNASSNDVVIAYLKKRFISWGGVILQGKYLHMRCIAHIINLIVVDGLKEISESVSRIRAVVRYIRQSPARLQRFKECIVRENIEAKHSLCLDVSTRWNSTYLMLDRAQKFEVAFENFDMHDPHYRIELEIAEGVPTDVDWNNARRLCAFLQHFYELTVKVSGTSYVTLNTFYHEISEVDYLLRNWRVSGDLELNIMATKMKAKYDKYWGKIEKMNMLIYIAVVLDPRHKLDFLEWAFSKTHDGDQGIWMSKTVRDACYELYDEYKNMNLPQSTQLNEKERDSSVSFDGKLLQLKALYKKHKTDTGAGSSKSELDKYLGEDTEDDDVDVLEWWKINSARFPILSMMARDVLAVPISTVASESAFSTSGRVLDAFRSSLTPKTVEAILCAQDWIRGSSILSGIEEDTEILEKVENELPKLILASTSSTM